MQLPLPLRHALEQELERIPVSELNKASSELTERYRGRRAGGQSLITSEAQRIAYAAVRMPATYAAVYETLRELKARLPDLQPRSLLDLGAGPGTATWAATQLYPELETVSLIEHDSGFIALGKRLLVEAQHDLQYRWIQQDLRQFEAGRHDLVILSYVAGELGNGFQSFLGRAWNCAAHALVLIEPGTPEGYRRTIAARDFFIQSGAHLAAPCPHERECPMLSKAGEWCHFAARVERTALHRRMKSGSIGHEDEKFSYLIFSQQPVSRAAARVVRHPLKHKGHIQLELCAQEGLRRETVSRKQGELYHAARSIHWGYAWPLDGCST